MMVITFSTTEAGLLMLLDETTTNKFDTQGNAHKLKSFGFRVFTTLNQKPFCHVE